MKRELSVIAGLVLALTTISSIETTARAGEADAALIKAGQKVFATCRACHGIDDDEQSAVGPSLQGIVGASSAARDDFDYSEPMRKLGIVWTEDALDKWVGNPKAFLPGSKMAFVGLKKPEDRKALIAFLKTKK